MNIFTACETDMINPPAGGNSRRNDYINHHPDSYRDHLAIENKYIQMKEKDYMCPNWKVSLFYSLLFMAMMSCGTEPECASASSSEVNVDFSRIVGQPDTSIVVSDTVVFARVYAIGHADSLIAEGDTLTSLSLPLKPNEENVTFVLENKRKGAVSEFEMDTISFTYQIKQRLISPDCGLGTDYSNLQVGENATFDSVLLINSELNRNPNANIQIFR